MRHLAFALLWVGLASACATEISGAGAGPDCEGGSCDEGDRAYCSVSPGSKGVKDVELDYLPNVLACENETAGLASLKAQAIAARSYLYYKLDRGESISDGQGDQVYSCGRTPSALHRQAVEETSGIFLSYRGSHVATFFVAGALQESASCTGGTSDPTATERYVTYNDGLAGADIHQSRLGLRDPSNFANRGCMSQNGANCLSDNGSTALEIIHFYYGTDIEVVNATGSCVVPGADIGEDGGSNPVDTGAGIGDDCSFDENACTFEAAGQSGECLDWFDATTNQLHGVCTLSCTGTCGAGSAFGTTYCAELDPGEGACLVLAAEANGDCSDIVGTIAQVVPTHEALGQAQNYQGVCAPPGNATSCQTPEGQGGECIDTDSMACGGQIHIGLCPGGSDIRCCTK